MENGWFIWNLKNSLFPIGLIVTLFGCIEQTEQKDNIPNFAVSEMPDATLICRLGNGYFSDYFRRFASKEQKYSHIGIISNENDSIFVYHSEASELTGVGRVKRECLNSFLESIKIYDFYELNLTNSTKAAILNTVKIYYKKRTPFDLDFDSYNDDQLYCTELISTAINQHVSDSLKIYPSLEVNGKRLFALDDIYLNKDIIKSSENRMK